MAYVTNEELKKFDPQRAGRYDPGEIKVFYDNRTFGGFEDKMPFYQKYKLEALSRLGRADVWSITDLPGGHLRIIFFTVSHAKISSLFTEPTNCISPARRLPRPKRLSPPQMGRSKRHVRVPLPRRFPSLHYRLLKRESFPNVRRSRTRTSEAQT